MSRSMPYRPFSRSALPPRHVKQPDHRALFIAAMSLVAIFIGLTVLAWSASAVL